MYNFRETANQRARIFSKQKLRKFQMDSGKRQHLLAFPGLDNIITIIFVKPYDILFFIALAVLLFQKNHRLLVVAGIISLFLSMINFALLASFRQPSDVLSHIGFGPLKISFLTAERLTWYAGGFFLVFAVFSLFKRGKK